MRIIGITTDRGRGFRTVEEFADALGGHQDRDHIVAVLCDPNSSAWWSWETKCRGIKHGFGLTLDFLLKHPECPSGTLVARSQDDLEILLSLMSWGRPLSLRGLENMVAESTLVWFGSERLGNLRPQGSLEIATRITDEQQEKSAERLYFTIRDGKRWGGDVRRGMSLLGAAREIDDALGTEIALRWEPMKQPVDIQAQIEDVRWLRERAMKKANEKPDYRYEPRLNQELDCMAQLYAASYVRRVVELCDQARSEGIAIGPGRGSAVGSLVLYLTGVTQVDPIKHDLSFDRWLSKERHSLPDIDLDIDSRYVEDMRILLGSKADEDCCVRLSSINTLGEQSVDNYLDRIGYGLKCSPEQRQTAIKWLSKRFHTISSHVSGVVIVPEVIFRYGSIWWNNKAGMPACHSEPEMFKALGIPKFDLLSSQQVTLIARCKDMVREDSKISEGEKERLENITYNDRELGSKIRSDKNGVLVRGVFSIGTPGGVQVFKVANNGAGPGVSSIDDLALIGAANRPGPRKAGVLRMLSNGSSMKWPGGIKEVAEPICDKTRGVLIYQEQVFELLCKVGGFLASEAWGVLDAIKDKDKAKIARYRKDFISGTQQVCGVDARAAQQVWGVVENFAQYGFAKSHAFAYAYLTWEELALKVHFPDHYRRAFREVKGVPKASEVITQGSRPTQSPSISDVREGRGRSDGREITYG
jgi:DNA polymerase III alpha subunit